MRATENKIDRQAQSGEAFLRYMHQNIDCVILAGMAC